MVSIHDRAISRLRSIKREKESVYVCEEVMRVIHEARNPVEDIITLRAQGEIETHSGGETRLTWEVQFISQVLTEVMERARLLSCIDDNHILEVGDSIEALTAALVRDVDERQAREALAEFVEKMEEFTTDAPVNNCRVVKELAREHGWNVD